MLLTNSPLFASATKKRFKISGVFIDVIDMIGMDSNNNSNNNHAHEMALEFLVSVLTMDHDRAHEITDDAICRGKDFVHEFYSSLDFHINALVNCTLDNAHPDAVKLIQELCRDLKAAKGTNFWDIYAIRTEHPDYKISDKLRAKKDDPTSYWKGEWR